MLRGPASMETAAALTARAEAIAPERIKLPSPDMSGGKPLMQALLERRSCRELSPQKLPLYLLSNLLWAAFGINRPATGGGTAPSAHDWEEFDIYLATEDGVYLYDAHDHALTFLLAADIRSHTGLQDYVGKAPLNLIYVADLSRMATATRQEKAFYSGPDAGFIAENVYLFCASEGLATVVRGLVDRVQLARIMKLGSNQTVVLAQSVGFPLAH
jgi:nitroreductase